MLKHLEKIKNSSVNMRHSTEQQRTGSAADTACVSATQDSVLIGW